MNYLICEKCGFKMPVEESLTDDFLQSLTCIKCGSVGTLLPIEALKKKYGYPDGYPYPKKEKTGNIIDIIEDPDTPLTPAEEEFFRKRFGTAAQGLIDIIKQHQSMSSTELKQELEKENLEVRKGAWEELESKVEKEFSKGARQWEQISDKARKEMVLSAALGIALRQSRDINRREEADKAILKSHLTELDGINHDIEDCKCPVVQETLVELGESKYCRVGDQTCHEFKFPNRESVLMHLREAAMEYPDSDHRKLFERYITLGGLAQGKQMGVYVCPSCNSLHYTSEDLELHKKSCTGKKLSKLSNSKDKNGILLWSLLKDKTEDEATEMVNS